MRSLRPARPGLDEVAAYQATEPHARINLSANENPQNLPHEVVEKIADLLPEFSFNRYPDPMASVVRELIAEANGLDPGNVLVGNGGDELIFDLLLAWGGPGRKLLNMPPTFSMYEIDAQVTGTEVVDVPRLADFTADEAAVLERLAPGDIDCVFVSNPNNPTGNLLPETLLIDILKSTDSLVLVDEAYFEFSRHTMRPHMQRHPNLVILRTFSKAFSLSGLRVGYLLANEDVIDVLTKVRQPYSVNSFSQWIAAMVFRERVVFEAQISELIRERDVVLHGLEQIEGVEVFPSEANFVMFRTEYASAVWRDLLHGYDILIRDLSGAEYLQDCLRIGVGTAAENEAFLKAMNEIMDARKASGILGVTNGGSMCADPLAGQASE